MAKMARERKVQERRALKQEKKQAAAAERLAKAAEGEAPAETVDSPDQREGAKVVEAYDVSPTSAA
jgi:hypothetical protein